MLRHAPNLSAFVGVVVLLLLCITTWILRGSRDAISSVFVEGQNLATPRASKEMKDLSSHKILSKSAPRITLPERSTNLKDIQNATLGFQKIFILSMPSRSDKRDGITLSAYLSELEVEFIDGVNPSLMSEKAYPKNWKEDEPPGTLGCWRGHMDIYQKMVRERIQSAMILEDDADWDAMIKAQMTEVARGARYLQKAPTSTHSPYGDNWDLLITGHCGLWNKVGEDQDYWITKDDPTVIHPDQRGWWRTPDLTPAAFAGNHTRVILSPYHFTCTGSYAISLSGAARALYDQAILSNAQSIDMGLGAICKRHEYGFSTCLGTYPMITGIHHQVGSVAKDSDRKELAGAPDRKSASSDNLIYPVRLNLGNLLKGETLLKAQYPEHAMLKEIDVTTLELPIGGPEFVKKNEYVTNEGKKDVAKVAATK